MSHPYDFSLFLLFVHSQLTLNIVPFLSTSSYGDDIVMAGFEGSATSLDNGNFDMTNVGTVGRVEVAKKGIVVLNNFMYTIREFEVS